MMAQQSAGTNGKRRGKSEEAGAAVMKLDAVRDKIGHLKQLYTTKREAATDYAEAVEAVATASKVDKQALASFVAAASGEHVAQRRERARQLSLLFEEVGA